MNKDLMSAYEKETSLMSSMSPKVKRVKIDEGEAWLLRFLPIELPTTGLWYMRRAQHWLSREPLTCPHFTPEEYGGGEHLHCPVCDLYEELNSADHKKVRNLGYSIRPNTNYLTWCVVQEQEDARGNVNIVEGADLLKPYEYALYKDQFTQLVQWARRNARKGGGTALGVIDLETGSDILASRGSKGTIFDKQEARPIFDLDEDYDAKIATIWKAVKEPKISIPSEDQIEAFMAKVREKASYLEEQPEEDTRDRRGGGRYDNDDDNRGRNSRRGAEDDDRSDSRGRGDSRDRNDDGGGRRSFAPRGRAEEDARYEPAPRRTAAPTRRAAPVDDQAEPEQEQEQPAPAPRRTQAAAAPTRRQAVEEPQEEVSPAPRRTQNAAPTRRNAPQQAAEEPQDDGDLAPAPTRRAAPEPLPARSTGAALPGRRVVSAPTAAVRPAAAPTRKTTASAESSVEEDEDNVAEEVRDPAPATDQLPADDAQEVPPEVEVDAPAPTRIAQSKPDTKLGAGLASKLQAVTRRGV